jgi:hypothetical protein
MALKRNISFIIKLHSRGRTFYLANVIATRLTWVRRGNDSVIREEVYVYVPGHAMQFQWIPTTFFVGMAA